MEGRDGAHRAAARLRGPGGRRRWQAGAQSTKIGVGKKLVSEGSKGGHGERDESWVTLSVYQQREVASSTNLASFDNDKIANILSFWEWVYKVDNLYS